MSGEPGVAGGTAAGPGPQTGGSRAEMEVDAEQIRAGVCECVAAALNLSPEVVAPEKRVISDLGADSLDLLDITFRLEQRFKISISPRDMERRTRAKLNGTPLDVDGVYTPEAIREFRAAMPEIPPEEFVEGLTVADFPRLFRVATLMNLVTRLMKEQRG